MKLGLKAPVPGAIKLRFSTYANYRQLPTPPQEFGHYGLVTDWGMLANSTYGCCAWSGAEHQQMLWSKEAGGTATFDDACTLQNYAATGFSPDNADSDQGTDLGFLANYWQQTGILDAQGNRHKVVAVVDLNPGDIREIFTACYLFQSVGLGFALPDSAMTQTQEGKPWDVVHGANVVGGHYVPLVGVSKGMAVGVTWGQTQAITKKFLTKYNNQGFVAFSEEMLVAAKSIDGFDDALLRDDLEQLGK